MRICKPNSCHLLWAIPAMVLLTLSCRPVKPYQRVYLNDQYMLMKKKTIEKLSVNVHSYREGASGGGRGKGSGGCGCN